MSCLHRIVFVLILGWTLAAGAAEPTLTVADGTSERVYRLGALLADPATIDVTLSPDPVYHRTMTYRAIPAARLLKDARPGADDHVQVRATDGFSVSIPARLLTQSGSGGAEAFLALEPPEAPWPILPGAAQTASAGPFYLVWRQAGSDRISSEYWSYRIAALGIVASPASRWPQLAVAATVAANDPIRRGQDRFVEICIACHRFNGAGESEIGPDLGQPLNPVQYFQPAALRQLLRDPAKVRSWPERRMPAFSPADLPESDIDAIIAWLTYQAGRR